MSRIVGIGANVCDTLFSLNGFPREDTKKQAESIAVSGGGPCATGLAAASRLGADCAYIGVLTDDNAGKFLKSDLERYNVSTDLVCIEHGYNSFTSSIWLNRAAQSRTCVYFRGDAPALKLNDEQRQAIADARILMIDGNEMSAAAEGVKVARENGTKVLYDAGGLYDGVDELLPYADILIPSEEFALGYTKEKSAEVAAKKLFELFSPEVLVITQGKAGGIFYDGSRLERYPAFEVDAVDTNGSGDVFHGAFAFAAVMNYNYYSACIFSSAVSALKCTKVGAREGVPAYDEAIKFLKERGIDEL